MSCETFEMTEQRADRVSWIFLESKSVERRSPWNKRRLRCEDSDFYLRWNIRYWNTSRKNKRFSFFPTYVLDKDCKKKCPRKVQDQLESPILRPNSFRS